MDTTEQNIKLLLKWYEDPIYIKMADTPEIQEQVGEYDEHNYIHLGKNYGLDNLNDKVWLPTQSQLQEMVEDKFFSTRDMIQYFAEWVKCDTANLWDISMEQLWLAFCMAEKFNKVWNGSKWIAT